MLRRELIEEFGEKPKGTRKALLEICCQQYGILIVLGRSLRKDRLILEDGSLVPWLGKAHLAWMASFGRNLEALKGGKPGEFFDEVTAIDPRFRSRDGKA